MFKISKTLLIILFLLSVQNVVSDDQVFSEHATIAPLAEKSLLLASDQHDSLTVVIGERGHVLYSYDTKAWIQAIVETKATLTNIFMFDDQTGWTVGHDAVILKTSDGAKTWQKVFSAVYEEAPLLDVFFKDALNGFVIGAYGLMYITKNGGSSWQKYEMELIDIESKEVSDNEDIPEFTEVYDLHLNAISHTGDQRYYIAAEAGHILRSDDDGKTWLDLSSPYHGSFFGVLPTSFNEVLVYGLRGHLYRSSDAGHSWEQIESHTKEMLTDAAILSNGDIVVTGLGGTLLLSKDNGMSFSKVNLNQRYGISAVLENNDGSLLLSSDAGIQLIPVNKFSPGT